MTARDFVGRMPGVAGSLLLVVCAAAAALVGAQSLFYEGWGQPVGRLVPFLLPALGLVAVGLVTFRWPIPGASLLVCAGAGAGWWWASMQSASGIITRADAWMTAAVLMAPLFLAAGLLAFEASQAQRMPLRSSTASWFARHWRSGLLVTAPVVVASFVAAQQLPAVAARHDDGARGARILGTDHGRLMWAPQGPGWNQPLASGELPAWNALVHHNQSSADRCAYLNDEGTALLEQAGGEWRLPTVSEIVGALSKGGAPAGCMWDGVSSRAVCRTAPDKETPLWAPDEAPIYYWSRQEATAGTAFAVNYTGGLSRLPKAGAGLNVGYRCVRIPPAGR